MGIACTDRDEVYAGRLQDRFEQSVLAFSRWFRSIFRLPIQHLFGLPGPRMDQHERSPLQGQSAPQRETRVVLRHRDVDDTPKRDLGKDQIPVFYGKPQEIIEARLRLAQDRFECDRGIGIELDEWPRPVRPAARRYPPGNDHDERYSAASQQVEMFHGLLRSGFQNRRPPTGSSHSPRNDDAQ